MRGATAGEDDGMGSKGDVVDEDVVFHVGIVLLFDVIGEVVGEVEEEAGDVELREEARRSKQSKM